MKTGLLLIALLLLASCGRESLQDMLVGELMDADRAFSALSAEQGSSHAFLATCSPDAVLLRENSMPIVGKGEVEKLLRSRPDTAFRLTWEPLSARVAASAELGYTYGTFALEILSSGQVNRGTYVSIWLREEGEWKWVLDTGNQGLGE